VGIRGLLALTSFRPMESEYRALYSHFTGQKNKGSIRHALRKSMRLLVGAAFVQFGAVSSQIWAVIGQQSEHTWYEQLFLGDSYTLARSADFVRRTPLRAVWAGLVGPLYSFFFLCFVFCLFLFQFSFLLQHFLQFWLCFWLRKCFRFNNLSRILIFQILKLVLILKFCSDFKFLTI
jgi:hypothetical protein